MDERDEQTIERAIARERQEEAEQVAKEQAYMQQHGIAAGAAYGGPSNVAYMPSAEQVAESRERERQYAETQLRHAALNSAIQYGHGHSRSASETIEDAAAFLKFLTVA